MNRFIFVVFALLFLCLFTCPVSAATWYVDASVSEPGDGQTWATAFNTVQEGIDAASDGDTIIVAPGIYIENIDFAGKNITLTSTDPLDPDIIAATIIDGNQSGSVVTFAGTENESCTLSGFTVQNGKEDYGAGISGGESGSRTYATIRHNTIIANRAAEDGGGLAYCDGIIEFNTITDNSAKNGGGLLSCNGVIRRNVISNNRADSYGGGSAYCNGLISSNTILENSASIGGGLARCDGTIERNDIGSNRALSTQGNPRLGYGGGLGLCQALIEDNVIFLNYAEQAGGGAYLCDQPIRNNVVTGNRAGWNPAGGLSDCDGLIRGNLIADNFTGLYDCDGMVQENRIMANRGGGLFECDGHIERNIICGNTWGREGGGGVAYCDGTIQNNLIAGNYHGLSFCHGAIRNNTVVASRSGTGPGGLLSCMAEITNCIIWGNEGSDSKQIEDWNEPTYSCIQGWTEGGEGNIAEDPRFVDPDGPDNDPTTYEDNDYRLRSDSPCVDAGFNEADLPAFDLAGMRRVMYGGKSLTVDMGAYEYYINEVHAGPGPSETTLTWSSIAGSTYVILYSEDLLIWILAEAGVPSASNQTTSWIDDGTFTGIPPSLAPRRFYRVLENP